MPTPARPVAARPQPPNYEPVASAQPKSRPWWIIPLALVAIGGVIWLLLAGLPFGGEDKPPAEPAAVETVAEGTSTADTRSIQTATVVEVPSGDDTDVAFITNDVPPNVETAAPGAPAAAAPVAGRPSAAAPASPTPTTVPRTIPVPSEPVRTMPVRTATTAARERAVTPRPIETARRSGEISESEAIGTLRAFVNSRNPYGISPNCVGVASRGYKNVGFTLEVVDTCRDSQMMGRWRVDSKTREVFRQRENGRYQRP